MRSQQSMMELPLLKKLSHTAANHTCYHKQTSKVCQKTDE